MSQPDVSTRPYLIRAIYEWCADQGFTPYLVVLADDTVRVPQQYVQDGQITLNVSATATSGLKMGNDWIEFSARFGGVPHEIMVPVDHVLAIYARENGQGMAFASRNDELADEDLSDEDLDDELLDEELAPTIQLVRQDASVDPGPDNDSPPPKPPKGRGGAGRLKRVK